jgi:predicted porin
MKKTLIALAALGVAGAASAQVAISGSIAVGVQTTHASSTAKFHLTDADINFSGKEDLGGGLSVSAGTSISMENLRAGGGGSSVDTGDQQGVVANNTTLGISGGFGSLDFGNVLVGKAKMGDASAETDITDFLGGYVTANSFMYTTPDLGGFKVFTQWTGLDNDSTADYKSQDLSVGGSPYIGVTGSVGGASIYLDTNTGNAAEGWDLRVKYDMGAATVAVRASKDKYSEFGLSMPMGAMTLAVNTASQRTSDGTNKATGLSVGYAMSKQTSVSFGYVTGKNETASTPFSGNNYRIQLKKAF